MAKAEHPHELRLVRVFEAPLSAVWAAWTESDQVAQWWGPRGFTITTHSRDLRTGGHWSYTMHGPDGTDYENKTVYLDVDAPHRLVYDHGGNDDRPPLFRVTVTFRELTGPRTEMDMTMALATPEIATQTRKFIKQVGGESTWDRLAEHVGRARDPFVTNRSFAAPIDTVWAMWTEPEHLVRWLAPTGSTMQFLRPTIAPGATSFFSMTSEDGVTLHAHIHYLTLERPHRLVYTQQFTDAEERVARHPFAPTWPETMRTTVIFAAEGPDETRVTVTTEVHGEANEEERRMFHQSKGGMTLGWTGSFDKLEAALD